MAALGHPKILTYFRVRSGFGAPARLALGLLTTVLGQALRGVPRKRFDMILISIILYWLIWQEEHESI